MFLVCVCVHRWVIDHGLLSSTQLESFICACRRGDKVRTSPSPQPHKHTYTPSVSASATLPVCLCQMLPGNYRGGFCLVGSSPHITARHRHVCVSVCCQHMHRATALVAAKGGSWRPSSDMSTTKSVDTTRQKRRSSYLLHINVCVGVGVAVDGSIKQGAKRHIWFSISPDLQMDTQRDLSKSTNTHPSIHLSTDWSTHCVVCAEDLRIGIRDANLQGFQYGSFSKNKTNRNKLERQLGPSRKKHSTANTPPMHPPTHTSISVWVGGWVRSGWCGLPDVLDVGRPRA